MIKGRPITMKQWLRVRNRINPVDVRWNTWMGEMRPLAETEYEWDARVKREIEKCLDVICPVESVGVRAK